MRELDLVSDAEERVKQFKMRDIVRIMQFEVINKIEKMSSSPFSVTALNSVDIPAKPV